MTSARGVRHRTASAFALACLTLLALSACGAATPLCDEAVDLVDAGALGRATETYARAERAGEAGCASGGLDAAGKRYADAYANVALGREAEENGEVGVATAAYQSALALDGANAAAIEALARLGQPAPQLRQPDPLPAREAPGEPRVWVIVLVSAAATAAACVLIVLAGWALWWRRGRDDRRTRADRADRALNDLEHARTRLDGASRDFDKARAIAEANRLAVDEHIKALVDTGRHLVKEFDRAQADISETVRGFGGNVDHQVAALRSQLDEVADYFGERLNEPQPVVQHFAPPHDGGSEDAEPEEAR